MTEMTTVPQLESLALDSSYVLDVQETDTQVVVELDAVLTDQHPRYDGTRHGEWACFKRVSVTFDGVREKHWKERSFAWVTDASGERDLGSLHWIGRLSEGCYEISGNFGTLTLKADRVSVSLLD